MTGGSRSATGRAVDWLLLARSDGRASRADRPAGLPSHERQPRRPIKTHYDELLTLAGLIDPATRDWIASVSRVETTLREHP